MNAVLTAKRLSTGHADRVIFSRADLVVSPGKVLGLVGANGAGKSTPLRMLAGRGDGARDAGSVSLNPATATVGYLPQEPERRPGESVLAFIGRRTGVAGAAAELDAATAVLETGEAGRGRVREGSTGGWTWAGRTWRSEPRRPPASLGLSGHSGTRVRLEAPMTSLSGGQASGESRVAIAVTV